MKFIFVPLDSVRVSPDEVSLLRQQSIDELNELRTSGHHSIGQHVISSADGTTVWLLFIMEAPYRENGR